MTTPDPTTAGTETRHAQGMKTRRSVPGGAHVDRAEANRTAFGARSRELVTERDRTLHPPALTPNQKTSVTRPPRRSMISKKKPSSEFGP